MRRSIRVRILAIFLTCITILAAIDLTIGAWGLQRVRDRAVDNSTTALQQTAAGYLQEQVQERANATGDTLHKIQQIGVLARDSLNQSSASDPNARALKFLTAPDGRKYYPGVTTIVLPSDADVSVVGPQLTDSQIFDTLMPNLVRQFPEIARISYLTTFGALRTYPALNINKLPASWTVQQDKSYQLAVDNPRLTLIWTGVHAELSGSGQVITVVAPINQRGQFVGTLAIDISLSYLTGYLKHIQIQQTGFAFLVDGQGHLIVAPEIGQSRLLGRAMVPADQGALSLDAALPKLRPVLNEMRAGQSGVTTADLRGRAYMLAYKPIATVGWSLVLVAPLDEITASTGQTATQITAIARETSELALLASLVALVLLALVISLTLGRQIIRPLVRLVAMTKAIAAGDLQRITVTSADEMGHLAGAFNTMTEALSASRAELTSANQLLEQKVQDRTAELDQTVKQLEAAFTTQQSLLQTLSDVSTPIIPVLAGVLVMPLIGQITAERAANMTSALLARIERERTHTVLLDVTGVPMIDDQVAQSLLQLVNACGLLGSAVVLVGVIPEVAQTLVTLGTDWHGIRTAADLRSAVEQMILLTPLQKLTIYGANTFQISSRQGGSEGPTAPPKTKFSLS